MADDGPGVRGEGDRARVRELLEAGHSTREVAVRTGIPATTVARWRRSLGAVEIRWRPAHEPSYALFCDACDALGVRWTLSNPRNVSVSQRTSVALLDELGCPKD